MPRMRARVVQADAPRRQARAAFHHRFEKRAPTQTLAGSPEDVMVGDAAALEPEDLLASGKDLFAGRQLDTSSTGILHQLVDDVDGRHVARNAHLGADAESIDRSAGFEQLRDLVLIEAAAGKDPDALEPGFVQDPPGFEGQLAEVA